jgi:endo-1,4-beta-xylanase
MKLANRLSQKNLSILIVVLVQFIQINGVFAQPSEIDKSIDRYRKGELIIKAKPAERVIIEQLSHEFWFGCAISSSIFDGSASPELTKNYREKFLDNFNSAVTENALKWGSMERTKGNVNYSVVDAILKWTEENNIPLRGHNLFWGIPQFIQPWVKELDTTELRQTIKNRAETIAGRYKGRFAEYDLNNEMVHGNYYEAWLGPGITKQMADWTHNGDPDAKLFLNDYDILTGKRLADYMAQIRLLLKQGVPVAGIGAQGHLHGETFDRQQLKMALDSLAKFHLPVRVTEFNMPGQRSKYYMDKNLKMTPEEEEINAKELVDYYKICFAHPAVEGILMWGFREGNNWIPTSSLYKRDWTLTTTGKAYRDLVFKEWWINEKGVANKDGFYSTRVFFGRYRVTVGKISKEVTLHKASGKTEIDFGK